MKRVINFIEYIKGDPSTWPKVGKSFLVMDKNGKYLFSKFTDHNKYTYFKEPQWTHIGLRHGCYYGEIQDEESIMRHRS